jgi:S1-C subfamily serine protease
MNGRHRLVCVAILIAGSPVFGPASPRVLGQTQAESLSASFRKAAERVAPAVVAVRPLDPSLLTSVPNAPIGPIRPFGVTPRLAFRVGDAGNEPTGSGVVVDAKHGYILTNDHILLGASQAAVVLADGRERKVSEIRRDPGVDLAVLVVDPTGLNLAQAKLGDANALRPGDWVLSIGQPGGSAPALSSGIYSSRRRGVGTPAISEEWLETDAAVNSLNSGGALVNLSGEVVGINTAQPGRRVQVEGMGFALPADRARRVAADLIAYGRARRAFLGVQIEPADRSPNDRPIPPGSVKIASVTAGAPAAEAGLRPGDVIVAVAGRSVAGIGMLQGLIETAPIGEDLPVTIERGGKRQDVMVRPRAQTVAATGRPGIAGPRAMPEARPEMLPGRVRGRERAAPRETIPPLPAPSAREESPATLDPIPRTEPPVEAPAPDAPKNQSDGNPR